MGQIFISYSRSDRMNLDALATPIRNVFGHDNLWFDEAIPGGKDWLKVIIDEIEKCDLFIYLVSSDSLASDFCQQELREALRLNKQILPVIVQRLKEPYPAQIASDLGNILNSIQYVDLSTGLNPSNLEKLFGSIHFLLNAGFSSAGILSRDSAAEKRRMTLRKEERWVLSNQ